MILCDVGYGARVEEEIRLLGVSAPERSQPGGLDCRDFVTAWFAQCSATRRWNLLVRTVPNTSLEPNERRSFVRFLATISDITEPSRVLNVDLAAWLSQHPEWGHGI